MTYRSSTLAAPTRRQGFTPVATVNDTAPSIATFAGGYILAYETDASGTRDIGYHIVTSPFSFPDQPPPIISIGAIEGDQIDPQIVIIADHATHPVFAIVFQDGSSGAIAGTTFMSGTDFIL
ncbi:hypothetical protein [Mesorhizobium sp. WSM2239]|uniref:Uncharacterized protein n=2 Tax=unclassified Mesorhizobium TaxID=325217 RepID=A0AAU8D259_9HYPH